MVMSIFRQKVVSPMMLAGTVLIGFSVPISVALDNLLLALVLLGALFHGPEIWKMARHHPVARAAMLLFLMLLVGTLYGDTPLREAMGILGKYMDLAFIPLFMFALAKPDSRKLAIYAFIAAMGVTLLLSYLGGFGILPHQSWMPVISLPGISFSENPVIFHSHIAQNNMMALAAFLAFLKARGDTSGLKRFGWAGFGTLALFNILFMVQGRTGYAVLLILITWFVWSSAKRYWAKADRALGAKQALAVLFALVSMVFVAYSLSPRLQDRVHNTVAEYESWTPYHGKTTSTGQRLDWYYATAGIIVDQPLLGVGTGGFPAAFEQKVTGQDIVMTQNPHNEYLMITVQTGVVGLVLLLFLFYTFWRTAPLLATAFEQDAARGLVLAYMVNCLFNSPLLDHADGLLFSFMAAVLFAGMKAQANHA
jgi:O-antigen ligase